MMLKAIKVALFTWFLLMLVAPAFSQNTKGDKPASDRETRFVKTTKKKKIKRKKTDKPAKPVKGYRARNKARNREQASRPTNRIRNEQSQTRGDRPTKASKRVKTRSASARQRKVYPQNSRFVNNSSRKPRDTERYTARGGKSKRVTNRSASARKHNIYPQRGRFVNNSSPKPRDHKQRAVSNRSTLARLKKLQSTAPTSPKKGRIVPRSATRSYRPQKSINVMARYPRPKRKSEKASTRDLAGRKLRQKNYETKRPAVITKPGGKALSKTSRQKSRATYNQQFGRFKNFSSGGTRPTRGKTTRVKPRSVSGSVRKVYPQRGAFVNNSSKRPRPAERAQSNTGTLKRLKSLQSRDKRPVKRNVIVPRSASGSYIARRSTNTWAHFPRPKRKGEKAYLRDVAGKKLRTKNYQTPPRRVIPPSFNPYHSRKRVGDRAYSGRAAGSYQSRTRNGRAWSGDVAGRRIRGIKKPRTPSVGIQQGGYKSATQHGERKRRQDALTPKPPGRGAWGLSGYRGWIRGRKAFADQGEQFSGSIKAKRRAKGGGSVSGRLWNNRGQALSPRQPGDARVGRFQGNLKQRPPQKGGGSVSGKLWNNNGQPVEPRRPGDERIARFQGNLKQRPLRKGGGSVSGRIWNNNGSPLSPKTPSARAKKLAGFPGKQRMFGKAPGFNDQGEEYSGNIKLRRPKKGGGSVSGKLWNNNGSPLNPKTPPARAKELAGFPGRQKMFGSAPGFNDQGEEYSGSIKARRPKKGGGSVSGKLWNNKGEPIPGRTPEGDPRMGSFQGTIKTRRPEKGGGSVSGKLWNNDESPINVRTPDPAAARMGSYSGTIKVSGFRKQYIKNPNASVSALKKQRPSKSVYDEGNLQVKVRQAKYVRNPNASSLAMRKQKPSNNTYEAGGLQVRVRQFQYVKNKHVADKSLKVREPGKAFARAADFQGNIKMQKFRLYEKNRELHPDARFIRTNKNNVANEKSPLTNFKLWWARLFKKSETQPDHLKEKDQKPRYDKGEAGLWYD
ncbi:MAG TPA: hypothetical protein VD927_14580 [Chryseosolibacter sp.]|nr:hypothetical protein [Chryseosolibacter sp.]